MVNQYDFTGRLLYKQAKTIKTARDELMSGDKTKYGRRVLTMAANQGKGWFAILLGKNISHKTAFPAYIRNAIFFARPRLTSELFFNIYSYRLQHATKDGLIDQAAANAAWTALKQYREREIDLAALKKGMIAAFPYDQIHAILANVD